MAYCCTGSHSRWATSTGSSSGPAPALHARRGWRRGLDRLRPHRAGPLAVAGPAPGLTAHHHRHLGRPASDGGQHVVDQGLLRDAQFHQVGPGLRCPHLGPPGGPDRDRTSCPGARLSGRWRPHGSRPRRRRVPAERRRHQFDRLGAASAAPTPTSTGVRGRGSGGQPVPGPAPRRPDGMPTAAAHGRRVARIIRPTCRQVTGTAPRATAWGRARSGRS